MADSAALAAVGDTNTVILPRDHTQGVVFTVRSLAGAAGANIVPEVTADDQLWEPVGVTPIAGGAAIVLIVAAGSYQVVLNSFLKARLRMSVLGAGAPVPTKISTSDY